jgi:hypothetical protein
MAMTLNGDSKTDLAADIAVAVAKSLSAAAALGGVPGGFDSEEKESGVTDFLRREKARSKTEEDENDETSIAIAAVSDPAIPEFPAGESVVFE